MRSPGPRGFRPPLDLPQFGRWYQPMGFPHPAFEGRLAGSRTAISSWLRPCARRSSTSRSLEVRRSRSEDELPFSRLAVRAVRALQKRPDTAEQLVGPERLQGRCRPPRRLVLARPTGRRDPARLNGCVRAWCIRCGILDHPTRRIPHDPPRSGTVPPTAPLDAPETHERADTQGKQHLNRVLRICTRPTSIRHIRRRSR